LPIAPPGTGAQPLSQSFACHLFWKTLCFDIYPCKGGTLQKTPATAGGPALLVSGISEATHGMGGEVQIGEVTEFSGMGRSNAFVPLLSTDSESLRTERLASEVQARDGPRDDVFLDLNEVAIGIGHGQHREHVLAARNNH